MPAPINSAAPTLYTGAPTELAWAPPLPPREELLLRRQREEDARYQANLWRWILPRAATPTLASVAAFERRVSRLERLIVIDTTGEEVTP
jgi:hypothetical protein